MIKQSWWIISVSIIVGCACSQTDPKPTGDQYLNLKLQTDVTYQEILGFGASDAWSTQFVGENWPLDKRNQIAELLFSKDFDDLGNPKGAGLSMWRVNLGGGSAQQGGASNINDEWRRAESFLMPNGQWDNSALKGNTWFLEQAGIYGVDHITAFVNSPPVSLTKNGFAYSSGGKSANISSENYNAFADYLIQSLKILEENSGVKINAISPFNETQWDWSQPSQEGSPWTNQEMSDFVKILNNKIDQANIQAEIELTDAAKLNFLYQENQSSGRDRQIYDFFNPQSSNYVGGLSHVSKHISAHSYFTTWPASQMVEIRESLNSEIENYSGLTFGMSEYCPLENNQEIVGNGRDLGIDLALYSARVIITDLVVANASFWEWWLAVSPYDYKDGLVYIDKNKFDGSVYDSKMLWAMGHFSRFVPPGSRRIKITRSDLRSIEQTLGGVTATGFITPDQGVTVVILNYGTTDIPVKLNETDPHEYKIYLTSAASNDNLSYKGILPAGGIYELPARSIVTLHYSL